MAEIPLLGLQQLREIVTDQGELAKGARVVDEGGLAHLARFQHKLFADAAGSQTYKVQILFEDKGVRGRCSCMAARSRPFCKHAAALLVAWANAPEQFAMAEVAPAGAATDGKKKQVKKGKVDSGELMAKGVEQVSTLVRELAVAGVAAMADDRAEQVRALGGNLREHKLRRLSGKTIALADLLDAARGDGGGDGAGLDESAYADLLADLLLTARKLEKHLAGEALDPRHVEELIGKTWTKKDRAPVTGLDLVEVSFGSRETADDFVIRESRFIELASGEHYAEKQILPAFLAKRTPAKPSYAGAVLAGASGSLYPSYAPRRIDLEAPERAPLDQAALARLRQVALPGVPAAIAALQQHKRDVFAPEMLPVAIACDMVIADRGRLQLADAGGAALFFVDDQRVADRLASGLAGVALEVVIGDLTLDGVLPTITPLAVLVSGRHGLELRTVHVLDGVAGERKRRARAVVTAGRSAWASTARAMGLSTAAIALGLVREELAALLHAGLASLTVRRVEPLVTRLRELSLGKQADLLAELPTRAEAAERLDDLIKLHQVLGIALSRLAGAVTVERVELEASARYASVYVRRVEDRRTPAEVAADVRGGAINRFEAETRYDHYYGAQPDDALLAPVYPTWADGSAAPYIVRAAARQPATALASAREVVVASVELMLIWRQGYKVKPPRTATCTALRVLETIGGGVAIETLGQIADKDMDWTVRDLARRALERLAGGPAADADEHQRARNQLFASDGEERVRAVHFLAKQGEPDDIPTLRALAIDDASSVVRSAASEDLASLGDTDSLDAWLAALANRDTDPDAASTAVHALGVLGDIRALPALLEAFESSWRPEPVGNAIVGLAQAALPRVIAFLDERPALVKRVAVREMFATHLTEPLIAAVASRLDELAHRPDLDATAFVVHATTLFDLVKDRRPVARAVGAHLLALRPDLGAAGASREARALVRKIEKGTS